ncbi:response regulator transcription factor [Silvibacterium sp.]|uniref:response regulator transcription factor n=1 Tax=Silvibacterium sp. TaxID=1964179 RepID=UPI0039E3BCE2
MTADETMSTPPVSTELEHVLLIDDDVELCRMLQDYLSRHGWEVSMAHRGSSGLAAALEMRHGLIVLDVMLPDFDGFELLRRLRREADVYVLLLTARGEEIDRIVGLELGADDYLPKPFNPRELLARMRAIVRRGTRTGNNGEPSRESQPAIAGFTVDHAVRSVRFGEQPLELTDLEFDLLHQFLTHPGEVLNREQLVERVLERPFRPLDRSLDMLVSRLRRKLETLPGFSGGIKAVRSNGYLFFTEGSSRG